MVKRNYPKRALLLSSMTIAPRGCWHKIFCLFVESSVSWLLIRERSKLLALSILGMYALLPPVLNHLQCIYHHHNLAQFLFHFQEFSGLTTKQWC